MSQAIHSPHYTLGGHNLGGKGAGLWLLRLMHKPSAGGVNCHFLWTSETLNPSENFMIIKFRRSEKNALLGGAAGTPFIFFYILQTLGLV